jgi:hypothetical protein
LEEAEGRAADVFVRVELCHRAKSVTRGMQNAY